MLVYDITNQKSFDNIRNWIRNIEEVSRIGEFFVYNTMILQDQHRGVHGRQGLLQVASN